MPKYTLKYNFLIFLLRLSTILAFLWTIGLVIDGIIKNGLHFDKNLFGLVIFISVPTILIYRISQRLLTESNLITLDNNKIEIYNLIKFKKVVYQTTDCIFFHSYRTPFNSLILKLPTGKYLHILPYDYFDFKKLDKIFTDNGINKEGYLSDTTT